MGLIATAAHRRSRPAVARALRVGIDATSWTNGRGFGRHTRALVTAMLRVDGESRYTAFVDSAAARDALPDGVEARLVRTRRPTTEAAVAGGRRAVGDLLAMSRALADPSLDVLLFPTVYSYVPVLSRARKLVTLHDVTAETYPDMALGGLAARTAWRLKVALARRQADLVLTHSEFSRRGIVQRFGLAADRVLAVGVGTEPVFRVIERPAPTPALAAQGLDDPRARLVVHVGGFSPHKRLDVLVDAFGKLRAQVPAARLVLVGDHERDGFRSCHAEIRARVERAGLRDAVTFTGFLPDADLAVLLNRATVLVLVSMLEGFGLPVLEAAACGCPAIATTASPLPEVLGGAVLPVRPGHRGDLVQALARVLGDGGLRAAMRAAAPVAAARHTWEAAATRVAHAMRGIAAT
jgi:glycosyltransferase involved in cell wall biosynthesis